MKTVKSGPATYRVLWHRTENETVELGTYATRGAMFAALRALPSLFSEGSVVVFKQIPLDLVATPKKERKKRKNRKATEPAAEPSPEEIPAPQ